MATDTAGNIYVAGQTTGALNGVTNTGGYDAFVVKLDPSGTLLWTRLIGTSNTDTAVGIGVDGCFGAVEAKSNGWHQVRPIATWRRIS